MPRIDPERLLKCLQPLLDPNSGAIRSTEEVDKILGFNKAFKMKGLSPNPRLMSKFSKKLVSKCIYINILRASHSSVVDLFMERGGWNLIFGWTNDAIIHKNYPLLKEIFTLLMTTPVTVARLRSNRFPLVIKNFSKDCEDEETRNICKQVVSRWITIAKTEEKTDHQQQQQQVPPPQPMPITPPTPVQPSIPLIDPSTGGAAGGELPNLGNMNTDHLLNIDPSSMNMISDPDSHQNLMDLDLTGSELAGIDFNLDILNKMVNEGHTLEDAIAGGGGVGQLPVQQQHQMIGGGGEINNIVSSSPSIGAPISVIQHAPAPIQIQQPQLIQQHPPQQIILEQHVPQQQQTLHPQMIQVHHQQQQLVPTTSNVILTNVNNVTQTVPAVHHQQQQFQIIQQQPQVHAPIKMEDPQQQQQQLISLVQVQQPPPPKLYIKTVGGQRSVVQDSGQYCLMVKDGKNYLVRLKEQQNVVVTSANQNQVTPMVIQQQSPQVPDGSSAGQQLPPPPPLVVNQQSQDVPDGGSPVPKKLSSKSVKKEAQIVSPVNKVPGDMKTYSKTKSSSSSSSSKDKKSSENVKPSDKDHHHKSSSSSSSKSKSDHHKKSKSSSSRADSAANKAAQAAAEAKEEERLREKIRREKAQMKKRQKEMDKQKQQTEKDQETLKKLNLIPVPTGSTTSTGSTASSGSSSSKIPKIPKRSNSSFADAIGIPGSDGSSTVDKIKKVSPEKSSKDSKEKEKSPNPSEDLAMSPRKFYGKKEEEVVAEQEKAKERRHKPKVFISSKSRSDDLLKEMTESGKGKDKAKEKEQKEKEEKEAQNAAKSTGILGNSIPATPPKMSKRLSTDTLEKPGDAKKAKLDGKEKKHESVKDKIRKQHAASAVTLKESSLFMDAISATETTKSSKKKRRTSSGGDGKDAPKPGELSGGGELVDEVTTPTEEVKKPVFNFYRETLNDEDSDSVSGSGDGSGETKKDESTDQAEGEKMDDDSTTGSFTPQENDGKVKSALVLVRSRNRKKKTVKWREEDELREFHYFEMDETERVNVTKQKDFADLSSNEMAIEGSFLKRRGEEEEPEKQGKPWRLTKIIFTTEILKPPVISTERGAQEEREKNVLGLFLPPGATLPDSAIEADVIAPSGEKPEPRPIPVEDVNTITKVCDYRTHTWPDPKVGPNFGIGMTGMIMGAGRGGFGIPPHPPPHLQRGPLDNREINHHQFPPPNHHIAHPQFPPQMVPNPTASPTTATPDYNPWNANLGFSVPPTGVPPPTDMGFGQFGAQNAVAAAAMNLMGQGIPPQAAVGFPPNPFAFPPPPSAMMNGPPPVPAPQPIMDFGNGSSHRGGNHRGGATRFDGNADRRTNNFHGATRDGGGNAGRDRDRSTSRDRDYRGDDRGGRDRDYRSRGGDRTTNDRDYRNHNDRDRRTNNRDFQGGGGRNIRKEIPCRFFKKGHCSNGSRCEFLHEGSTHSDRDRSRRSPSDQDAKDGHHSRHQNSNSSSNNSNDEEDWEKSTSNNIPDSAQSPPQEEQVSSAPPRQSRFSDAPPTPMSPTDDSPSSPVGSFQAVGESTKVIPV